MDISVIISAYNGLKTVKDIIRGFNDLKIETESLDKINAAIKNVGEAQDTVFQLRKELSHLQEENNRLKQELSENEEWTKQRSNYELVKTKGGAVVYKSKERPNHYSCPNCIERREIQILQDRKVMFGDFNCPGCGKDFPVNPSRYTGSIQTDSGWDEY